MDSADFYIWKNDTYINAIYRNHRFNIKDNRFNIKDIQAVSTFPRHFAAVGNHDLCPTWPALDERLGGLSSCTLEIMYYCH